MGPLSPTFAEGLVASVVQSHADCEGLVRESSFSAGGIRLPDGSVGKLYRFPVCSFKFYLRFTLPLSSWLLEVLLCLHSRYIFWIFCDNERSARSMTSLQDCCISFFQICLQLCVAARGHPHTEWEAKFWNAVRLPRYQNYTQVLLVLRSDYWAENSWHKFAYNSARYFTNKISMALDGGSDLRAAILTFLCINRSASWVPGWVP